MTISVVQEASSANAANVSLSANVTAGNSVILLASAYNTTGTAMSTSAPTYNGNVVAGAVKLIDQQSPFSTYAAYGAIWLLPDLPGGAKGPFALTFSNDGGVSAYQAFEIAGLGASPVPGPSSAANGSSISASSGTMGALAASALVVGFGAANNEAFQNPPATSPWTAYYLDTGYDASGTQIASSGSLSWTPAMVVSAQWAAMIVGVYATAASSPGTAAVGGFSRNRARTRAVTGMRTVGAGAVGPFPGLGSARVGGLYRNRPGTRAAWRGGSGSAPSALYLIGGVVRRRSAARGVWRGGRGTLGPQPQSLVGGAVRRRGAARGLWHGGAVTGAVGRALVGGFLRSRTGPGARAGWRGGAGTLGPQPRSLTGGLIRRRSGGTRAVWRGVAGAAAAPVTLGTAATGGLVRRRGTARGLWRGVTGSPEAIAPARYVTGGLVRRRGTARVLWKGGSGTVGVIVPLGVASVGGVVRRRAAGTARGLWRGHAVSGAYQAAAVGGLVRNRASSRAVWRGKAVPPAVGVPVVGGAVLRRPHGRAVWRGGEGVLGPQPKPSAGGIVRRRGPARAEWRGGRGTQAPPPPNGTVPRRIEVARRPGVRAVWRGVVPVGANSLVVNGPPLELELGQPYWNWVTGPVGLDWGTGQPELGSDWVTGPVGFGWGTGQPGTGWTTGPIGIG